MEITIKINGQAVSVEVSYEVYECLCESDHKKEAQERVTATPAQKECAKAYNRLKARKQRGKISVDDWNAAVAMAQDLKEQTERGELSDEELRRQLEAL